MWVGAFLVKDPMGAIPNSIERKTVEAPTEQFKSVEDATL